MAVTNGWGKGVENNTIGWGKAADNATNGFGAVYASSAAGDTLLGSAGTFDPDAQVYFTAVEDAGGTLTDNVKAEFDAFVVREKDAGRWSKIKRLYPYLGGVINSAVIDAVTTNAATNNNFVDADVDATIGLQGDGSTKALVDTQAPSSIFSGDYNWGGYHLEITAALSAGDTFAWGAYDASNGSQWAYTRRSTGNAPKTRGNLLAIEAVAGSFISNGGSYAYNKTSNTSTKIFVNGGSAVENTTTDTGTLSTTPMAYFAASNTGSLIGYCPAKVGGQALWSDFNDADVSGFDTSYKTFINNITAYAAAQAYFAAVETAGGTLTTNVESEFSAFVSREVEANRWSKLKRLYPYLGGVINSAIIDAVTLNSATNTNFVDGDVDATIGLQGDGSTKSLRLTETTSLILPDSADFQIGVFRIGAVEQPSSLSRLMGHFYSSNPLGRLYLQKNSLQPQVFATDSVSAYGGVLSSNSSHIGASFSSSDLNVLLDGVVVGTSSTARSTSFSTHLMDLFALNINGTPSSFSSIKSGGMFIASGLSLAETQAFESSYKTFINNITA